VRLGLKYGFIMFIMSEVMFFAAWFWAFFKHAIYPMNTYEASTYVPPEIYAVRSLPPAADQHADAASVGLRGDLGAPRAGA
jgi:heme/copper-type cytochrome/quinol oxidase subunit 3